MNRFKEGKQQLENLTKLQELRNALKELEEPGRAPTKSVNDAFNHLYVYFEKVAGIMGKFFKDNKTAADLLKKAGVSARDIETYLEYWATFDGKSWNYVSKEMRWGYEPDGGPKPLSWIEEIANKNSLDESLRMKSLEDMLGINSKTKKVADLVASICDEFTGVFYKISKETEKSLTAYLQKQKTPKTSIFDLLRKEKDFDK